MKTDFAKYYTPEAISSALVKLLDFKDNCKVVDICCGSGNLLCAAQKINKTIICHGVDVNKKAGSMNEGLLTCDGRDYAIKHVGEYDFALANPPFGYSGLNQFTKQLFCNEYANIQSRRLEVEMLIANLMVLKDTGILLIIIPTTIVDGVSMTSVRKIIAKNHSIHAIVDLPINAFAPEKIKCSALIIIKTPNACATTEFYTMDESFNIHKKREIDVLNVLDGNWIGELFSNENNSVTINQGTISSQLFCQNGVEVLHTSKKSSDWKPSVRFANIPHKKKCVIATQGDIIISRIGASAGQKCIYQGPPRRISDCLLIIKSPSPELAKEIISMDFLPLVSGLSTPHITAYSIFNLLKQGNSTHNEIYLEESK